MSDVRDDLAPILRTIREVEQSLERRLGRASGANLMIWGLATSAIFLFYQFVEWNTPLYEAAFGPALGWVWLAPIALGFAASAILGARLGRFGGDRDARRHYRRGVIPGVVATALAAFLVLTGRSELINGVLCGTMGAFFLSYGERGTRFGRACLVYGGVMVAAGVALLAWHPPWSSLATAALMGGGLFSMGAAMYLAAR